MPRAVAIALVCALLPLTAPGQDWANWRGPNHDGTAVAKGLPADFSQTRHVKWAADLPGPGAGTPIVVGDRVFLPSVDRERQCLVAMCLSRKDGKVLWKKDAASSYATDGGGNPIRIQGRSNYASPSPATDGKRVLFFYGNGDLVAYDLNGEEEWRRNLQKDYGDFSFQWTFSASPTIWEGKVFIPVLQRDDPVGRRAGGKRRRGPRTDEAPETSEAIKSFLLALDPANGKTLYQHVRKSPAQVESREAYATLTPFIGKNGRKELLCVGGDVITGHDPATGSELWRWGTWNEGHRQRWWRLVPSVVVGDGLALVCAPKRAPVYAVKLGGSGAQKEDALAWKSEGRPNLVTSDVPTPAFHDGHFFVLSDVRHALSKIEAKTGKVVWSIELTRDYAWRASPTIADGKVFLMNHNGRVVVADAKTGELLHQAPMAGSEDDQIRSSIVVAGNKLFIRTNTKLFCIGK